MLRHQVEEAWQKFLDAAAEKEQNENFRRNFGQELDRARRVGQAILDATEAEPFREFWVCTESYRVYRCRDQDHVYLDIDTRTPWKLQVVVTDADGWHVIDAHEVKRLLVAFWPLIEGGGTP